MCGHSHCLCANKILLYHPAVTTNHQMVGIVGACIAVYQHKYKSNVVRKRNGRICIAIAFGRNRNKIDKKHLFPDANRSKGFTGCSARLRKRSSSPRTVLGCQATPSFRTFTPRFYRTIICGESFSIHPNLFLSNSSNFQVIIKRSPTIPIPNTYNGAKR